MSTPYSHLFCEQPFTRLELSDTGDVYTCCPAWLRLPLGNVQDQTLDELWNSQTAQDIRSSIHDGSFRYCDKNLCPRLKAEDMPRSKVKDSSLLEIMKTGATHLDQTPIRLNLCYDRSCNLQCPSCRTELILHKQGSPEWTKAKRVQDQVMTRLEHVEWLEITGSGDPFASPLFFELLQRIDSLRYPKLKVFLHTNGLLWTQERWEMIRPAWPSIVKAEISIDAVSEITYGKLRKGGHFSTLLRNLSLIASLRSHGPIKDLKFSFVVQSENYQEIPAFVEFARRYAADRVYFSMLDNWGTFSEEEYRSRAIHLSGHPEHEELKKILSTLNVEDTFMEFGNLLHLFAR